MPESLVTENICYGHQNNLAVIETMGKLDFVGSIHCFKKLMGLVGPKQELYSGIDKLVREAIVNQSEF